MTNRITWEVSRIVRVYRHRWTGTETFHRDGKQQLGLGDCQLRDVQGQTRHMYLVMLAYSLLMGNLAGPCEEWALHRLMTIGEACRAVMPRPSAPRSPGFWSDSRMAGIVKESKPIWV